MKKKNTWKTPAIQAVKQNLEESIQQVLTSIAKGRHPALKRPDELFEILEQQLEKIEKVKNPETQLMLLGWFLNGDALLGILSDDDYDDFQDLYSDASAFFIDIAKDFDNKMVLQGIIHDLAIHHTGEDGRVAVFLSVSEFLNESESLQLIENIFQTLEANELENETFVLDALRDITDGLNLPEIYEKASFMREPDRSNAMILDVANAYFIAGNLVETKRFLKEVQNPGAEDEEEFLDLSIGYYYKVGDMDKAKELAEALYEKFSKPFHLARLVQIVDIPRREILLNEYEKFRLSENSADSDYIDLLISIEEFERLSAYLEKYKQMLTIIPSEVLKKFSERLESCGKTEIAKQIRDWTVDEPEEMDSDEN